METISRERTERLLNQGTTVVEVLDEEHFQEFHLPGAVNVPLGDDFETRIQQAIPDKAEDVVLYCYDTDCDASSKAGSRMEALGYQNVYDYEAGKVDWQAANLPVEA